MAARRRGVVKQLSNLSIDEVSLVDRGANQHALISIAKRAPEGAPMDVDELFEKKDFGGTVALHDGRAPGEAEGMASRFGHAAFGVGAKTVKLAAEHPVAAVAAAGAAGTAAVVHNHFGDSHFAKNLDVDDLFAVEKKGGSSFGRGGQAAGTDTFAGNDSAKVTDDENGEDGNVGPGGKIDGVESIKGEDTPPKKKSSKAGSKETNPSPLSGLGKSADFWTNVVSKILSGESTTDDVDDYTVGKHFPGGGGQQPVPGNPMNPQQSPFPGAMGAGQPPAMQTTGVQPMGMGQPTPPPMGAQPNGGMPQQLPPDVVQYIQQLEQALDQATGGQQDGEGSDDTSQDPNAQQPSNDKKNNPFGKSGDFDMSDDLFLSELAKSLDSEDQREAVGKALEAVGKAEQRALQAETIAKQERDLRLEREFVAKAEQFAVPVDAQTLGGVLKRMAESVSKDDFQVIVKCLNAVSAKDDYFGEVGKRGGGSNASVLDEVNARAVALSTGDVSKGLTPEQAVAQVFDLDPRAYDAYLSDHPSRRISR